MTIAAHIPDAPHAMPPVSPRGNRLAVGSLLIAPLATFAFLLPLVALIVFGPRFKEIFVDFGVALPAVTRSLLQLSDFLLSPAGIGSLALMAIVVFVVVAVATGIRRRLGLILLLLCFSWTVVTVGLMLACFWTPLVAMIESLQQGGAV